MYPYDQAEYLRLMRVKNVSQVPNVSVQPMQRALVVCEDEPVFAFVQANGFGQTSAPQYYRMEPFEPATITDTVSRAEFTAMQNQLNQIVQMLTPKEANNESAS